MIKKAKLLMFQEDLRNGMTIEDALIKHELIFKDAVIHMPRPLTNKRPKHYRKKKHGGHTQ